ncbi:MAG: TerB family tellurite resistance protein [Deltaproteobacteria bacterium]
MNILKQFLGKITETKAVDQKPDHDILVAVCALLVEIARIDETFNPAEMETILTILEEKYGLSRTHADALIKEAEKELEQSVDLWQFAKVINENYSIKKRIELVETLWRIVFVDGKMDKYEHHLMYKLAKILRLHHDQLIEAKLKVIHPS